VVDKQRKLHLVRCKVCSKIDGKDKMFALKIDNLWKHAKRRKALVVILGICGASKYYMSKNFVPAKNERLCAVARKDSIFKLVYHLIVGKRKKKLVQFSTCFHMLVEGRPMIDFESMNKLVHFLDVKNFPKTHWSNTSGWEMASCMHDLVVNKTKTFVEVVRFISHSYDEVTISNQQS